MEVLEISQLGPIDECVSSTTYRAVHIVAYWCSTGCSTRRVSRLEEYNSYLPFLDGAFGSLLDVLPLPCHESYPQHMLAAQTHNGCNIGKVLDLADSDGLHEELVTAFCI